MENRRAILTVACVVALTAFPVDTSAADEDSSGVRALTFDVFGTVVDWRSSTIDAGQAPDREAIAASGHPSPE